MTAPDDWHARTASLACGCVISSVFAGERVLSEYRAFCVAHQMPCTLIREDESVSNPYIAQCGTKFDTYEEMAAHNRWHEEHRAMEAKR